MDENVLIVPAKILFADGEWMGLTRNLRAFRSLLTNPKSLEYRPRSEVETDPSVKQLIPYAVIRRGEQVFAYQRGKAGGENRLHDLWSIGVGGHICREDGDSIEDAYRTGFSRELDEEVSIAGEFSDRIVGLLYDPRTPVGTVHVGVVHVVDVNGEVASRDPSLIEAGFRPLASLAAMADRMESWSQFVIGPLAAGDFDR